MQKPQDTLFQFLSKVDALKLVERRTSPIGASRRENSAEHSWHVMLAALLFRNFAAENISIDRVLIMLLLHDLGEIEGGDTFHYAKSSTSSAKEAESVKSLLALLPDEEEAAWLYGLWEEFEGKKSADARYAAAIDRFMAFISNSQHPTGGSWREMALTATQVVEKNQKDISQGAPPLWELAKSLIQQAQETGSLR